MEATRDMTLDMMLARGGADRQRQSSIERVSLEERLQCVVRSRAAEQARHGFDMESSRHADRMAVTRSADPGSNPML
jgi:hypothetical protein